MLPLTAEINVTPFLDVLLVLIITFLAAMSARQAMDARLSKPCDVACASDGGSIVLEVLADGLYALDRQPVPAQRLLATLHATYDARPEKVLQVAGHRDASYQQVLSAMDAARTAGVNVIGTSRVLLPFACSPAGDNHDRERCELSGRQVRARARLGPGSVRFLSSMSVSA